MNLSPFSLDEAREAARMASAQQAGAESEVRKQGSKLADAEQAYRVALAKERARQHAELGVAWTATDDAARGEEHVARLRHARDLQRAVYEAAQAALWRHAADRKDVGRFIEWSMRRELAEGYGDTPEPAAVETIGGRRAA